MLHRASRIRGATIRAIDGDIGKVEDFYFEEDRWTVRYLVVDSGGWLGGRRVVISPMSVTGTWNTAGVPVALTKEQVRSSPEVDLGQPLSRTSESRLLGHYGYPRYWDGDGVWGTAERPGALLNAPPQAFRSADGGTAVELEADCLRSTSEITGYHLHTADGEIGHVDDFLIGEESWRIRYLLVDTSNWIGGKWVVVSTEALKNVDRGTKTLHVALTRDQIKESPSFESIEAVVGPGETGPPFVII